MANIVFLGNFRVDYTSETHHANTLESLGHKVTRLQESEARSEDIYHLARKSDLFIWIHTHGWRTPGKYEMTNVLKGLSDKKIKTITYHLDLWFGLQRQKDLDRFPVYKNIEYFFTVDKKMSDWFNERTSVKGYYVPAGVYDKECYLSPLKKTHDVVFVGSKKYHPEWQYRPKLINWLSETYGDRFEHYGNGGKESLRGEKLNDLYASSKIVVGDSLCLNYNYPDYWSDRVYETIGRGGFIIHPYISGMEREFEDKKHLVFYEYGNFEQLKKLIDYYLDHDEERETIRKAGHELVKSKYTYKNRWEQILKELKLND